MKVLKEFLLKKGVQIDAVILDLGGIVFGISVDRIIESWSKSAKCHPKDLAEKFKVDRYYELFEIGAITPDQYRKHVCRTLDINLSPEEFDRGWNSIYLDLLPGIDELLNQIKKNHRLIALTNTNAIHAIDWRVRYFDTLKHFEKIFASHEIKARKPNPESFQIVLDYLKTSPENVVFFDDNPENVNGARFIGIHGFVATSPEQVYEKLKQVSDKF